MASAETLDSLIEATAETLALPIDPAWMPSLRANLDVILKLAQFVDAFPLPDEAAPAPVITA